MSTCSCGPLPAAGEPRLNARDGDLMASEGGRAAILSRVAGPNADSDSPAHRNRASAIAAASNNEDATTSTECVIPSESQNETSQRV